jgi:3-isopropylmalate/(R)-2-methylmalate dehydratase small subunit
MGIQGNVWVFGDDVDTDQIYPGKYLPLTDKAEMARHAMEGAEGGMAFIERVQPGDILVAGKNFGCGSSREHAVVALQGIGVRVVIARSFARIFRRNAVNIGLPILQTDAIERFQDGDCVEIDLDTGTVRNTQSHMEIKAATVSKLEMSIMKAGGLLLYLKQGNE